MLKALCTFVLFLCVCCIFGFIILYYFFNLQDPENAINTRYRKYAIAHTNVRKLLRLHQVGDARYEYMTMHDKPLEVYLYYQDGVSLDRKTVDELKGKLYGLTRRYTSMTIHEPVRLTGIPDKVTDEDIKTILKSYGTESRIFAGTIPLHIFVLSYYLPHPSYAGLVTDAHSLILFKQPIEYVSESKTDTYAVEISTILHEFGHLLGANHIDSTDCVMADTVESLDFYTKVKVRDSYCPEDLDAINRALR